MKELFQSISRSAFVLVPVLLCLALSLWYQLRVFDTHIVFIFDSAHYFLASSQVLSVFHAFLAGDLTTVWGFITEHSFVANLMLDGPVLPILGALALLFTKHAAFASSWPVVVALLTVLNACSTGAVAFIAKSVVGSKKLAAVAACLFAIYPTTITSSGRFLTEPVATFFLLLLLVSSSVIVSSRRSTLSTVVASLCAGAACALGFLLKPALLPAWFICLFVALFYRCRARASLLVPLVAAAVAIVVILGSWLAYTKVATGKFYLMPQRQPASNVAQGHELETDGRGAMGYDSPTDKVGENDDSRAIFLKAWVDHPQQISNLYLRKMARTLGFAWNDFKQKVFGLDIEQQDFLHGVVLSFGVIGLVVMLLDLAAESVCFSSRQYFLLIVPALIMVHATLYIPFESTVRYGAPALPLIVVAAVFAWQWLFGLGSKAIVLTMTLILLTVFAFKVGVNIDLLQQMPLGKAVLWLATLRIAALLLLSTNFFLLLLHSPAFLALGAARRNLALCIISFAFIVYILLPVSATTLFRENQRECRIELSSGAQLSREVFLPAALANTGNSRYLIYVDCDSRFASASFTLNDVVLEGKLISANKVDSACYFVFNIMRMYASIFDLPVDHLRQWRVLEVPASLLRFGGSNSLRVKAGPDGLTVFADRFDSREQSIRLPNKALFSASRMCNEGLELDGRVLEKGSTRLWPVCANLIDSAAQLRPLLYRQPRFYLLQTVSTSAAPGTDIEPAIEPSNIRLALEGFDPVLLAAGEGRALKIDRYTMQLAKTTSITAALPQQFRAAGQVQISLKGMVRSIGRSNKIGVFLTLHGAKPSSPFMILPGSPPFVEAGSQFSQFEISDRIFLSAAPDGKPLISVGFFPGRWEQFSQYGVDRSVGSFLVKDLVLSISKASNIDLHLGQSTLY